jgi:hypothetical protein
VWILQQSGATPASCIGINLNFNTAAESTDSSVLKLSAHRIFYTTSSRRMREIIAEI